VAYQAAAKKSVEVPFIHEKADANAPAAKTAGDKWPAVKPD
jgi:hypothetical protein